MKLSLKVEIYKRLIDISTHRIPIQEGPIECQLLCLFSCFFCTQHPLILRAVQQGVSYLVAH